MQWELPTLKNTMFGRVKKLEICLGSQSRLWPCITEEGKVLRIYMKGEGNKKVCQHFKLKGL